MNKKQTTSNSSQPAEKTEVSSNDHQIKPESVDPNSVRYVYVNKKTGKITNNPHVKSKSEGCLQFAGIALAAVALVIAMVSGTVLLTNYCSEDTSYTDEDNMWLISSFDDVSSMESSSETSSAPDSSDSVSSEDVSSVSVSSDSTVSDDLTSKKMNKKIKGKWKTEIPYKNMSLPGTFEFDGKGNVNCTIKAFLFTKKFTGTYQINDGGKCRLTLDGLDEYFEDDTIEGNLRFVNDDQLEFTVEDTVWKLTRTD